MVIPGPANGWLAGSKAEDPGGVTGMRGPKLVGEGVEVVDMTEGM